MKKNNKSKRNFIIALIAILGSGAMIGYSALSQTLTIGGTATMDAMKWDVGFTKAIEHPQYPVSEGQSFSASISNDKKSVTIMCDFGTSTGYLTCDALLTVTNNSTFDVKLASKPSISYDSEYINTIGYGYTADSLELKVGHVIPAGGSEIIHIFVLSEEITESNLPSTAQEIPITITMEWIEA